MGQPFSKREKMYVGMFKVIQAVWPHIEIKIKVDQKGDK